MIKPKSYLKCPPRGSWLGKTQNALGQVVDGTMRMVVSSFEEAPRGELDDTQWNQIKEKIEKERQKASAELLKHSNERSGRLA